MIDIPRCPEPAHPAYRNRWYAKFHQVLKLYHISSLYFLAGTIGTALFVQIGETLTKGGPGMSGNQLNCKTLSSDRARSSKSIHCLHTMVHSNLGRQQLPWYEESLADTRENFLADHN